MNDPWMKKPFSMKMTRAQILEQLHENRAGRTAESSRETAESRGIDEYLHLIRKDQPAKPLYKFNDLTDFDVFNGPGLLIEELQKINCESFGDQLQIDVNSDKKYLTLNLGQQIEIDSNSNKDQEPLIVEPLKIKLKFFKNNNLARASTTTEESGDGFD